MTKFGLGQLKNETPKWALWILRIVILLTSVGVYLISSDDSIPDATQVRLLVCMKAIDMFTWGIAKMFGVTPEDVNATDQKSEESKQV